MMRAVVASILGLTCIYLIYKIITRPPLVQVDREDMRKWIEQRWREEHEAEQRRKRAPLDAALQKYKRVGRDQ